METPKIYTSLLAIMSDIDAIGKNKKNPQQGFMYRGIDDLYNDLHALFAKHGVIPVPQLLTREREERQTKNGGILLYTMQKIKYTFYASDGSNVSAEVEGEAMDSGDKSSNKAMSAAMKYCLLQMFLIPTEDLKKDDPDGQSPEAGKKLEKPKDLPKALPNITEKLFNQAKERIGKGELDLYDKIINAYNISEAKRIELFNLKNNYKPVTAN